jgi:hypothetical protein
VEVSEPAAGVLLRSSCQGEYIARVESTGQDANGQSVLALHVFNLNDILDYESTMLFADTADSPRKFPWNPLTYVRGEVSVVLEDVLWRKCDDKYPELIEVVVESGTGCYLCVRLFSMHVLLAKPD